MKKINLILLIFITLILGVFYVYIKVTDPKGTVPTVTDDPKNESVEKPQITDEDFIEKTSDPQGEILAKGDINGDGYEDAIVQEIVCGASCSVNLVIVLSDEKGNLEVVVSPDKANFAPAFRGYSAIKSEISDISIENGIISLTGKGLSCLDNCTEEKWNVVRTVKYKFDNGELVQIKD